MMRRGEVRPQGGQRLAQLDVTEKGVEKYQELKLLAALDEFGQQLTADEWDGIWRILIYDIAESERYLRDVLRALIEKLGCQQFQRSVWVTPYDCSVQVAMIQEVYGSKSDIALIEADRFAGDEVLIRSFNL